MGASLRVECGTSGTPVPGGTGYRFHFFSNEGEPGEPIHIHIRKGSATAKSWVDPGVVLASAYEIRAPELNRLQGIVERRADEIRRAWHEHFGD